MIIKEMRYNFIKYIQKSSPVKWIILLIILTIPTFYSLIRPGFFPMQDDLQAFRIHQMDKCVQDFQIPCRWVPDAGFQYGYPQFIFYPPSVYYLGEAFHLLGFQFIDSVKILFVLGFILSTLSMFLLLRSLFGNWPAFVGSLFYSYIPYKAVEVYVRGAMSEFWSLVIFPLIFWASLRYVKTLKLKYFILLSLSVAGLLITHNLMSLIFLPLLVVWCLFWVVTEKKKKTLIYLMMSGVLGLGLAAYFSLPVILEKPYVHLDSILSGYFDYRRHFVDLWQLFFSYNFGYGSSELGPGDDLALSTGIIQWIVALLAVGLAAFNYKKYKQLSSLTFILAFLELGVLFMMHQKSSFVWEKLSFLVWLQFPWRLMADSIFLLAILGALAIYFLQKTNLKYAYFFGGFVVFLIIAIHLPFFQPKDWLNISDKDKFSGISWEKQLTISIFDYLPIYGELPPPSKAPELLEVLSGEAKIIEYKKGSNFQEGKVIVIRDSEIRLPLFDYPGMVVTADGKVVPHKNNNCTNQSYCLGLISYNIPPGEYTIKAELKNSPVRAIGNVITLVSIGVLGALAFKVLRK